MHANKFKIVFLYLDRNTETAFLILPNFHQVSCFHSYIEKQYVFYLLNNILVIK